MKRVWDTYEEQLDDQLVCYLSIVPHAPLLSSRGDYFSPMTMMKIL
jgi:hypothetical protein